MYHDPRLPPDAILDTSTEVRTRPTDLSSRETKSNSVGKGYGRAAMMGGDFRPTVEFGHAFAPVADLPVKPLPMRRTTETEENARLAGQKFDSLEQEAQTDFVVEMNGENSSVNLVSRSVARDNSHQAYRSKIVGNAPCAGHSECDAIIEGNGRVDAAPGLTANHGDAALIHEAAIGKIAGEQIAKLRTLGLTEEEAEARIVAGFLK